MEIRDIHIEGFGALMDYYIGPLSGGLVIFSGRNEAGKSTLLSFVNAIFFGFPDARRNERLYRPMPGVRYGGRITISTKRYGQITIERIKGSGRASLKIYGPDMAPLDAQVLKGVFGGVTKNLFQNVYSFSLQELQSLESLRRDEIKDAIYGAGFGTSFLAVPQALRQLKKQRDAIYRPLARKLPLNQLLGQLKEVNLRLKKARTEIDRYKELTVFIKEAEEEISNLKKQKEVVKKAYETCKVAADSWQDWLRLNSLQDEISALGADERIVGFSPDMFRRVEMATESIEKAEARVESVKERLGELEARIEHLRPDARYLAKRNEISHLLASKANLKKHDELIEKYRVEIRDLTHKLQSLQEELGSNWTFERIRGTVLSQSDKHKAQWFENKFNELESRRQLLRERLDLRLDDKRAVKARLDQLRQEIEDCKGRLFDMATDDWDGLSAKVQRLKDIVFEIEDGEKRLTTLSQRLQKGMKEVFTKRVPGSFEDLDLKDLGRQASHLKEEIHENKRAIEECWQVLRGLKARKEETEGKIEARQKRMNSLELPMGIHGLEQGSISRIFSLVQTLSGSLNEEIGLETEGLRLKTELDECIRQEASIKREMDRQGPYIPHLFLALALALMAGSGILAYYHMPPLWWGVCLVGAILSFSARAISARKFEQKQAQLAQRSSELYSRRKDLEKQAQRVSDILKDISDEKRQLTDLLGITGKETSRDLSSLIKDLEDAYPVFRKREQLITECESLKGDLQLLDARIKAQKERLVELGNREGDLKERWNGFLERHDLVRDITPDDFSLAERKIIGLRELWEEHSLLHDYILDRQSKKEKLMQALKEAGFSVLEGADEVGFEKRLQRLIIDLNTFKETKKRLEGLEQKYKQADIEFSSLKEEISKIKQSIETVKEEQEQSLERWNEWLVEKDLEKGLAPSGLASLSDHLSRARQLLAMKEARQSELKELEREAERIAKRVFQLFDEVEGEGSDLLDVVSTVDLLYERLSQELKKEMDWKLLRQEFRQLEQEKTNLNSEIKEQTDKIEHILKDTQCKSKEELREVFELYLKMQDMESQRTELAARLKVISGAEDLGAVSDLFKGKRQDTLLMEAEEHLRKLKDIEANIKTLIQKQAEANMALEELISSDEHMELLSQRSSVIEEIRELSERWAVHTLSLHILEQARDRFERENQPQVIRAASNFFSEITLGRYAGIAASAGSDDMWAVTDRGERVEIDKLSRGTAEQLYLCLRFGVISACDTGSEVLPVLMDDILVNFDPERTKTTANVIGQLSRHRQILFFTCQPHVARVLKEESPGACLINMDGGGPHFLPS